MFEQPYQHFGGPQQSWPSLEQNGASWDRTTIDYSSGPMAGFDLAPWQYPAPAASDCSPFNAQQQSFGAVNTPLPPAPERFSASLPQSYTPSHTSFAPSPLVENSPASSLDQPGSSDGLGRGKSASRPTSPAPQQALEQSRPGSSTFDNHHPTRPSFLLNYSSSTSSADSWAQQIYGDNASLQSITPAGWPAHLMPPLPSLPLPPSTAAGAFSATLPSLDQERAFPLHQASPSLDYNSWSQTSQWGQLPELHDGRQQQTGTGRTSGTATPSSSWDWPFQLNGAQQPSNSLMSRTTSSSGTAPTIVPCESEGLQQSAGSSSLSSSGVGAGLWDSNVSTAPWNTIHTPPPLLNHRHSAPDPLEHLSHSNFSSRRPSLASTTSHLDLALAATTSTADAPHKGVDQSTSTSSDPEKRSSVGSSAAAGDQPKVRKQRRKANEPPRDAAQRRYACELCVDEPRMFARPSALKIHLLTHTKEKPHNCPTCHRAFAIASNLKRHQKLHRAQEAKDEAARLAAEGGVGTSTAVAVEEA